MICWADLAAKDMRTAATWYQDAFGWAAIDFDVGPDGGAVLFEVAGKRVASISQASPDPGAPVPQSFWLSYLAVDSVDRAVEQARRAGATLFVPAFDVLDLGREAILQDPVGALIALWEPRAHRGAELVGVPGSMCWSELVTSEVARAADFYRTLAGWSITTESRHGQLTAQIRSGDRLIGGISPPPPSVKALAPLWLLGLGAHDCTATERRLIELRGTAVLASRAHHACGQWAWIRDPQGALFAVVLTPDNLSG